MNLVELTKSLTQLRLGGMAEVIEARILQAQTENMPPIDFIGALVSDELARRGTRLIERRTKQAEFRDPQRSLDNFDFDFNKKINRRLVFELATGHFITRHEDVLFLGPPGTGKSHLAQAIGQAAIRQGHRVLYREAHVLLDGTGRSRGERNAQAIRRGHDLRRALDHRRHRHAQAPAQRCRGHARDHHAPLRAGQHHPNLEPAR
jgi:DNA replication protein DnaC